MVTSIFALLSSDEQASGIIRAFHYYGVPLASVSLLIPRISRGGVSRAGPGSTAKVEETGGRTKAEILDGHLGWLVGIEVAAVADDSPFLVVGALLAGITGPAAMTVGGGIALALIDLGMPAGVAQRFDRCIGGGSILLALPVTERNWLGHARRILAEHDVDEVCYAGAVHGAQGRSSAGLVATSNSASLFNVLRPRVGMVAEACLQSVPSEMREGISPATW